MNRRQQGEELWKRKFDEFGLSEHFELIGRDWESDHGALALVRCKSCNHEFKTWNVKAYFRGRLKTFWCPECGMKSDGTVQWTKSFALDDAVLFYAEGHTAHETAEKFNVPKWQIVNAVTKRKISNGLATQQMEREERVGSAHRHRAKKWGLQYDKTVTLKHLIERDGLTCAICGKPCDPNDKKWNRRCGPMYPTIDHIIPMSKGGGHTWDNVQVAHMICNTRKQDKTKGVSVYDAS